MKTLQNKEQKKPVNPLVYRKSTVIEMLQISETTLRRFMATEGFPKPVQLGPRAVAWPAEKVQAWLGSRPEVVSTANMEDED